MDAAQAVGVDAGVLARIAAFESGFNVDAAPIARDSERNRVRLFDGRMGISSAHGLGQFTDATWRDTVNRYGGAHGVAGAGQRGGRPGSLPNAQVQQHRADPRVQAAMLAELTRDNIELGRRIGGASDDANVYSLHNLGTGDGSRLLQAVRISPDISVRAALVAGRAISPEEARRIEAVISGNRALYGDGSGPVQRAYDRMAEVMAAGDRYAAEARAMQAERGRAGAAPAPAPAPAAPPAARSGLTAEALRGPTTTLPAPPAARPEAPSRTALSVPAPAPPAAVRVSVAADRPVQVVALVPAAAPVQALRIPVAAAVSALPAAPPVAEVFRADQIAQNCDQDDRRPEPAPRRAAPPDRGVAHSVRSWTPAPRLSRDPFEAA